MNKPFKPRKPSPRDKPPQEYIWETKFVGVKGDDIVLVDSQYSSDGFRTTDLFPLNKTQIAKLILLLKDAGEVDMVREYNYSDDQEFNFIVKKSVKNTNYKAELEQYDKRFELYEEQSAQYEKDKKAYDCWKANIKKAEIEQKQKLHQSILSKLSKEEREFLKI